MLLKEKEEIIAWLNKHNLKNYTLRQDETHGYVVDVDDSVYLWRRNLTHISVKFGVVSGYFDCARNQLTSLEGGPDTVGKHFDCGNNQLTSLKGGPKNVEEDFYCNDNQLISLQGIPESIGGYFYCRGNPELGEIQSIKDFKVIKSYFLAEKLADKLAQRLEEKNITRKIKL